MKNTKVSYIKHRVYKLDEQIFEHGKVASQSSEHQI
jgi:hypothetical protein